MLMQYMFVAVWWVPIAAYLTNLGVSETEKTLILCSIAIGSFSSPILGALADRYFSAQKVLAVANVTTAVLLLISSQITNPTLLFITILLTMICYMPTWSLTSTIAMHHASADEFPRIRMFGSIGWILSGFFSLLALNLFDIKQFDSSSLPMVCAAGLALITAITNLSLPNTPAIQDGESKGLKAILGLDAMSMYKDRNFLVFSVVSVLAIIPFALFYSFGSQFIQDNNFQHITLTLNLGQVTELFFLFVATSIIRKLGIKKSILIGLATIFVRYVMLYTGVISSNEIITVAPILLHGLIFGMVFVTGQVYTDNVAPAHLKGQAQGLLSLVIWGAGLLIGNVVCGYIIKMCQSSAGVNWDQAFMIAAVMSLVPILIFLIWFKPEKAK